MIKVSQVIRNYPRFIWGIVSVGIYLFVVGVLIFYFNTHEKKKSKHYVKKNENRIQVALSSPKKVQKNKRIEPKAVKPKPKPKNKPKMKAKVKPKPKKIAKKKVVKRKKSKKIKNKDVNLTKPLKKKTKDLFAKIKIPKKKNLIQVTDKPIEVKAKSNLIKLTDAPVSASKRISDSLKNQKNLDSGVENAYFAKVQDMLEAWPARSDFLGEEATVTLFIKPTGKFQYQVTSSSSNEDFARSVIVFLNQLQGIGFGRHDAGRSYEFEVKFSTKE